MPAPRVTTETVLPVACFAPALDDATIARYRTLADGLPDSAGEVRDVIRECLRAVEVWWDLPESTERPARWAITHRGRQTEFLVTPLSGELKRLLWDAVPWPYELDAMQALLDRTFEDRAAHPKELVDATYHLLWHARELCLDREPVTNNALTG